MSLLASGQCRYSSIINDLNDGTVIDSRTGLVWKICPLEAIWSFKECGGTSSNSQWDAAVIASSEDQFLHKSDWRLPSIDEAKQFKEVLDECDGNDLKRVKDLTGAFWSNSASSSNEIARGKVRNRGLTSASKDALSGDHG
jgi:Protein of unknown function (DUF1566)